MSSIKRLWLWVLLFTLFSPIQSEAMTFENAMTEDLDLRIWATYPKPERAITDILIPSYSPPPSFLLKKYLNRNALKSSQSCVLTESKLEEELSGLPTPAYVAIGVNISNNLDLFECASCEISAEYSQKDIQNFLDSVRGRMYTITLDQGGGLKIKNQTADKS